MYLISNVLIFVSDFSFPLFEVELTSHPNNGRILQKLKGQPSVPRIPRPAMSNHVSNTR